MSDRAAARRILLVEDEELVRDLATRLLVRDGYEVTGFSDGVSGWEAYRDTPDAYDLVLLDVRLPCLSGALLGRRIHELRPKQAILFTSGLGLEQLCADGTLTPDDAFVAKPYTPESLRAKVREVIELRAGEAKD